MPLIETFRTDRLVAERLQTKDFSELHRLHQNPQVMAWLSADGTLRSQEQTWQSLHNAIAHWEQYGYGGWAFRNQADGRFVGYCGLKKVVMNGNNETELLYAVLSDFWGQGLATEMAKAVLMVAFEQLDLTEVVSYTLPNNWASQRVIEKVGFKYERHIVHASRQHVFYRITTSAWQENCLPRQRHQGDEV